MQFAILAVALVFSSLVSFADGLNGKVMCGYQGWFRTPDDGTGLGWHHYEASRKFEPGFCSIDLWPDVREIPEADRTKTAFQHPDGSLAEVYSSVKPSAIALHFKWMRDNGIDGVFLQRFATTTRDERFRKPLDTVMGLVRQSAMDTGRTWALMYDLSGLKPGQMDSLIADWKRVHAQFRLTDQSSDPAYLRHRGKPLVALWGLGFSDRAPMLEEWQKLISFLKDDAEFGGCTLMVGVPTYWRTLRRDAIEDPELHKLISQADVVSPWTVGRYNSPKGVAKHATDVVAEDIAWCRERKLDYLPVSFPGFSWHNLSKGRNQSAPINAIPRLGGEFLWSQFFQYKKAGADMFYVAMFDEVDEATAIFKVRNDPPAGDSPFVSEPGVPGDQYLWLTGMAGRLLRGDFKPENESLPRREK
ncbi:MAG TPA: glycoside hydrolase family 71/99-like protein [Chthoniobacteraceae bacterium]|nr:glycoside hydrolase family 71/99-like protein [Chthoniobacteraceae bacterium]